MLIRDVRETGVAKKTRQEKNVVRSKHCKQTRLLVCQWLQKRARDVLRNIQISLKFQRS